MTAFSGGLPRPEFQDRHAVTVMQGQEHHVCFHFGSEIKDFLFIPKKGALDAMFATESDGNRNPSYAVAALIVLTERELLAFDLMQPDWPAVHLPYLSCLNISPVTAIAHLSQVPNNLLQAIRSENCPVWGGSHEESTHELLMNGSNCDILILGQANGLITLLAMGKGDCVYRIGTLHTASMFSLDGDTSVQKCVEEETWPPFRRVGYCASAIGQFGAQADPRLLVTTIEAHVDSSNTISLVVGSAGGHVTVWTAGGETACENQGQPFEGVTSLYDCEGIVFTPRALVQLHPPAPISSIACENSWNLLAIGSPHGFAIIDLFAKSTIYVQLLHDKPLQQKLTHAVSSVQRELVSRGKQFTATMRQSFRRLKHLRTSTTGSKSSETGAVETQPTNAEDQADATTEPKEEAAAAAATGEVEEPQKEEAQPEKPGEEEVHADQPKPEEKDTMETVDDWDTVILSLEENPSSVRSLLFTDTFLLNATSSEESQPTESKRTPSLWVGTANGRAIAHVLKWEGTQGPVTVQPIKELQLRHQAPIISMYLVDAATKSPVSSTLRKRFSNDLVPSQPDVLTESPSTPQPGETSTPVTQDAATSATTTTTVESHQLLVCSDEQIKLFSLPTLRALHKYKFSNDLVPSQPDVPTESPSTPQPGETSTPVTQDAATSATTTTTVESHQLLVCSDEQIKLFSLPTLRALHKYKFVDRIRLPYSVGHITLTPDTSTTKPERQVTETTEQGDNAVEVCALEKHTV
ncbi:unnamed protein product [Echinostoma caproni]|uniref:Lethal giant larvae homologue 2 domain-containing protein n=1 Tax=Echinostoma caproni TaxID=27848 RepID=A0A3P8GMW3_9TREM|nr:unnamed protein product [Echinostoma caproni]